MVLKKSKLYNLMDILIKKRDEETKTSGFRTVINSNHICAILKDGHPISYGSNNYILNKPLNKHAESQAFDNLINRIGKINKKIKIDVFIIRTNKSNSRPCKRCMNEMINYNDTGVFNIRNIYYTSKEYENGIRNVKFSKLVQEESYYCSYDIHYNMCN